MKGAAPWPRWRLLLLALLVAAPGCSSYVINGTVVHGLASDMTFVERDDPRLNDPPVSSVRITVQRDPDKLSRKMAGTDMSDARGRFSLQVDEFGTGWMKEEWLIQAFKPGYKTASVRHVLRPRHKDMRLLVILTPGVSHDPREADLIEQYERYR